MKLVDIRSLLFFLTFFFYFGMSGARKKHESAVPFLKRSGKTSRLSAKSPKSNYTNLKISWRSQNFRADRSELLTYNKLINNCSEAPVNGIYQIKFPGVSEPINARCETKFDNKKGSWIVIQRRLDGTVNFYRDWEDYKYGFGDLDTEFFYGLEKIYLITTHLQMELAVLLYSGSTKVFAVYSLFRVGSEGTSYTLTDLGSYSGTAGDSLEYHRGKKFSTYERKNDESKIGACAISFMGGWWYNCCYQANLNGRWTSHKGNCDRCIKWNTYQQDREVPFVQMMIRPSTNEIDWDD